MDVNKIYSFSLPIRLMQFCSSDLGGMFGSNLKEMAVWRENGDGSVVSRHFILSESKKKFYIYVDYLNGVQIRM